MATIASVIMDDTNTLTAADWDFDPNAGTGSIMEIDPPEDFDSEFHIFDPYI